MPFLAYKILHLVGLFLLFTSMGGLLLHAAQGGTKATLKRRGLVFATHGIALFLILLSGFGMLAKMGIAADIPAWAWAKVAVWLVIGGLVALPLRVPALARPLWLLVPLLGGVAAWLALAKPF